MFAPCITDKISIPRAYEIFSNLKKKNSKEIGKFQREKKAKRVNKYVRRCSNLTSQQGNKDQNSNIILFRLGQGKQDNVLSS